MSWPRRVTEEQLNKADAARLRDTFAAAALTGLLAAQRMEGSDRDTVCKWAYIWADAMLRERERVTEPMTENKRAEVALTESEREAVEQVLDELSGRAPAAAWVPDILRNLLERLK